MARQGAMATQDISYKSRGEQYTKLTFGPAKICNFKKLKAFELKAIYQKLFIQNIFFGYLHTKKEIHEVCPASPKLAQISNSVS